VSTHFDPFALLECLNHLDITSLSSANELLTARALERETEATNLRHVTKNGAQTQIKAPAAPSILLNGYINKALEIKNEVGEKSKTFAKGTVQCTIDIVLNSQGKSKAEEVSFRSYNQGSNCVKNINVRFQAC
jgi:hypothetical protein